MKNQLELTNVRDEYGRGKIAINRYGMATASLLLSGACAGVSVVDSLPFANLIRIVAGVLYVAGMVLFLSSQATMKKSLETLYSRAASSES